MKGPNIMVESINIESDMMQITINHDQLTYNLIMM